MAADLSLSGCGDELAQASVPSLSPTKAEKPAATITVDSRSPVPTRRTQQPNSSSQWLQSPFQNLEAFANMSPPGSNMSMSSFCFSSPGKFSPGRPSYGSGVTPAGLNYRMSPDTPLTNAMTKDLIDELASPMFSPVLFSPYDTSLSRQGQRRESGANSKLSLAQDFLDIKQHSDSPHPDIFSSLSNTGILHSAAKFANGADAFPPGFSSYRKAFPEMMIADGIDNCVQPEGEHSETSAEASGGCSSSAEGHDGRPESLSTDSTEGSSDSLIISPTDIANTPLDGMIRLKYGPPQLNRAEQKASFCSPAIPSKKNLPHNISPALSENSTPSHCNCKKSKCLKLYCECFAALRYCNNCKCVNCHNRTETEQARQVAIQVTKDRNSGAFESKVNNVEGHATGCNCKKSQCLKKYCECFEADAHCGDNCKCTACQNFAGSAQLEISRNLKHRKSAVNGKRNGSVSSSGNYVAPPNIPTTTTAAMTYSKKYVRSVRSPDDSANCKSAKRRRVMKEVDEPMYPFFGENILAPKSVALRCLEFLPGKDIYSTSLVNHLWCKAAMDNALWETDE